MNSTLLASMGESGSIGKVLKRGKQYAATAQCRLNALRRIWRTSQNIGQIQMMSLVEQTMLSERVPDGRLRKN
jgi:hypothetical protein